MANYKRLIQNQLEKAKSTASDFLSSKSEDEGTIDIEEQAYAELKKIAAAQNTSVLTVVRGIIGQYLASVPYNSAPISVEQKEENPLLYLDAICKHED
jgi:hypothetical protein